MMDDTDTKLAIYDMAIRIMGTPLLPTARTDVPILSPAGKEAADIEALIATAETELLAAIAAKFASLRAAARATSPVAGELPPNAGLDDLVRPMMILRDYVISRAELFRRCVEHPVGTARRLQPPPRWRRQPPDFVVPFRSSLPAVSAP
ncbi:hypothetical protein ACVWZR_004581 [Bradyrhizobium sp. i1.3.1]